MSAFDPFAARIFRGGGHAAADGAATREIVNPATLEIEGRIALCAADHVNAVAAEVAAAQKGWAALDHKSRARLLHQVADSIERTDPKEIALLMVREMGKPYPEATGEIANCAPIFRYMAEMARDCDGQMPGATEAGSFQFARYFPYGVSAHVTPFNFPILLMCWTVAASLAAGNGCVVKPAEATTLCTLKFMEHFAALPDGLVACVTGGAETGQALIRAPEIGVVAFTGSVAAGRAVAMACAERMIPCVIEAGGSDPMIISEHADLDIAVPGCVMSAFHLSGQICTSSERFFVHEKVHDAFVARLAEGARTLRIGPGWEESEIGPLVSEAARAKVIGLVEDAAAKGAEIVCGGRIPPGRNTGWYYEPTVLTDVTAEMRLTQEECFGPVAAIAKIASFDEAIERANASRFGLGASVFTQDMAEAMRAYERLEAGMVWVNNPLIDNDALPFGGWKQSGLGRELGRSGLDAFRRSKMGVIDAAPSVKEWWYPYPRDWFLSGGGRGLD